MRYDKQNIQTDDVFEEIEYPMAFVILGGLVTSTLLNLIVLPPLYLRFGRPSTPNELRGDVVNTANK